MRLETLPIYRILPHGFSRIYIRLLAMIPSHLLSFAPFSGFRPPPAILICHWQPLLETIQMLCTWRYWSPLGRQVADLTVCPIVSVDFLSPKEFLGRSSSSESRPSSKEPVAPSVVLFSRYVMFVVVLFRIFREI